jgi:hypothetical protein
MISLFRHMTALLIIVYLSIPVMGFAHFNAPAQVAVEERSREGVTSVPCDQCPCGDEQGSDCCDSASCSCSFHSPPVQTLQIRYSPVVNLLQQSDPFWILPQVYLTIFVPPQNVLLNGYLQPVLVLMAPV